MKTKQELKSKTDKTGKAFEAMMAAYRQVGTPGAPHALLAGLEGSWISHSRGWMEPGQPPMEGSGTCEQKMILGGRYLQQEYTGEMMGETFHGINLVGYDNHTGKFVSVWLDSMSTGIYSFEGSAGKDGKSITQDCHYDDPVKGPTTWRSVTRFVDSRTLEYEMYLIPDGGVPEKVSETTLTRKVVDA